MSFIKDACLTAVYGKRGSGKTTRIKQLLRDGTGGRRVVIFDPRREYAEELSGVVQVASNGEFVRAVQARWSADFTIAFIPTGGHETTQLHLVASMLMAFQAGYDRGEDARKLTLVVEEMNLGYPASTLPADLDGMARLCNQGRHFGVNVIGATQYPTNVSRTFRANLADTYIFALAEEIDRKHVLSRIGDQHRDALRQLAPHEYLLFRDGEVSRGTNKKPAAA